MNMRSPLFSNSRQHGFTLIEVMAVLIIIGIAAAVVSFNIGDGSRPLQIKSSARQLYGAMNLVIEEAIFTNKQFGLRFDIEYEEDEQFYSYEWLQYDPEIRAWKASEVEEFQKQELPYGIILKIEIDEQSLIIGSKSKKEDVIFEVKKQKDEKKPTYPDMYFLSSGEMQNFKITIADEELPDSKYLIKGNMLGQLEFRRPDEEE